MSNFKALHDSARADKLNLDELYEYKKMSDSNTLKSYNKVIERIHTRIRLTSRQKSNQQCCWFVIPEVQIGIPKYDVGSCIAYIMKELNDNGFQLRYTHPNLIFISWNHWVPDYARMEIKKQTGVVIDGFGNKIKQKGSDHQISAITDGGDSLLLNTKLEIKKKGGSEKIQFKPTGSYKPKGNLVYGEELFNKIDRATS
jgi:hypothetical protein